MWWPQPTSQWDGRPLEERICCSTYNKNPPSGLPRTRGPSRSPWASRRTTLEAAARETAREMQIERHQFGRQRLEPQVEAAWTEALTGLEIHGQRRQRARRVLLLGRGLSNDDKWEAVGVDSDTLAVQAGVGLLVGLDGVGCITHSHFIQQRVQHIHIQDRIGVMR